MMQVCKELSFKYLKSIFYVPFYATILAVWGVSIRPSSTSFTMAFLAAIAFSNVVKPSSTLAGRFKQKSVIIFIMCIGLSVLLYQPFFEMGGAVSWSIFNAVNPFITDIPNHFMFSTTTFIPVFLGYFSAILACAIIAIIASILFIMLPIVAVEYHRERA